MNRCAIRRAASAISVFCISRTTVAAPVAPAAETTSTVTMDKTSPCQQANIVLAGRPPMNCWMVTRRASRLAHGHSANGSRPIRNCFQTAALWGFASLRKATTASSREWAISTPVPPHVPSSLSTPAVFVHQFPCKSSETRTSVAGVRIPSSAAACSSWPRLRIAGYISGAPNEYSINGLSLDSELCRVCSCQTTASSHGTIRSGCDVTMALFKA